jgi:hypothetical protein
MLHPVPKREVWQNVEVRLELALEFDPEKLERSYSGLVPVLAELLIGPPRLERDSAELWPYAGLKSLAAQLPHLRLRFPETRRLGIALDGLFTAIDFQIVGQRVLQIPPPGPIQLPQGWRALSGVWLCHQPLE